VKVILFDIGQDKRSEMIHLGT